MKKNLFCLLFLLFVCLSSFAKDFTINVVPGKIWENRKPQCAIWVQDEQGNYVGTLFITKGASQKSWFLSPKEGRPDSLPVWYHSASVDPANPKKVDLDGVTSATPKKSITVTHSLNLESGKKYFVFAEFNQSFDYNDVWTKKNSGVNGQPSVVYCQEYIAKDIEEEIQLNLVGTGSIDGSSGVIDTDKIQLLTTANDIVSNIFVVIK